RVTDPERARTILRCAQEIVTNSARHSGAENLWVVIDRDADVVRIRAHDDGRGAQVLSDGFGLRAMRGRVEKFGGELRIVSGPGRGFDVVALVPIGARTSGPPSVDLDRKSTRLNSSHVAISYAVF